MDVFGKLGLARFDTFGRSKEHVQVRTISGATGAALARRRTPFVLLATQDAAA